MKKKENSRNINGKNERMSNFELLRIICMFLIIAHHFSVHGQFNFPTDKVTFNREFINFLALGGKLGVNCFVLISGYFLVRSKKNVFVKLVRFWFQTMFYSVVIYLILCNAGLSKFTYTGLFTLAFPILFEKWWFVTAYFMMFLFSPFVNKLLKSLDENSYRKLVIIMIVCWSVVPTFTKYSLQCNNLLWFMVLYVIAGYFSLFPHVFQESMSYYMLRFWMLVLITFGSTLLFDYLGIQNRLYLQYSTFLYGMNMIPMVFMSIFLFLAFANMKVNTNYVINRVAASTFGIYLIHDNESVRTLLWSVCFENASYAESINLPQYAFAVIIWVFVVCSCIDLLRIIFVENIVQPVMARIFK